MAEPVVGPKAPCGLTVENNHVETIVGGDIRASVHMWWLLCLVGCVDMTVLGAQVWAQT